MAMSGPRPWLLLPLALLAAGLAQPSEGANYQDFVNRHIDFPKTGASNNRIYCNRMMARRGLTRHNCKHTNTFIHASSGQLRAVCGPGGRPVSGNLRDSLNRFPVTICREAPGSRPGQCRYRASTRVTRVRVGCTQNLPVHLDPQYLS